MPAAVSALNGSPSEMRHRDSYDANSIWDFITYHDNDRDIITCASPCTGNGDLGYTPVANCHAYTVISTHTFTRANGDLARILKVRNPWGAELYKGPWSDNWNGWTQHDREQLPNVKKNDGLFYIDVDSYVDNFSHTAVN